MGAERDCSPWYRVRVRHTHGNAPRSPEDPTDDAEGEGREDVFIIGI